MSLRTWLTAPVLGALLWPARPAAGAAESKAATVYTFGTLKTPTVESARAKARDWLVTTGKPVDDAAFNAIWEADKPILDRVTETLVLGDPAAAKLLAEARDPAAPAPKESRPCFGTPSFPVFYRNNLALAYAKALSGKRVYEEALDALQAAVPEQVVDPAAYYFHKAVAEHALIQKKEAIHSIARLLDDVADCPERYKMVATLMFLDMQSWKDDEKDLTNIAKLMDNSERRLDLGRPGPKTQEIQKKIVFRLDELIKDVENQMKNGGQTPVPRRRPAARPGQQPAEHARRTDSRIMTNSGPGVVDQKKLQNLAANWGKLPEKERAKAMMELTKDLPPRYREVIENYFKTLARGPGQ